MTRVIVPVKDLSRVKTRLSGLLPLKMRQSLVLAMLSDVLSALNASGDHRIIVVGSDRLVKDLAATHGADFLDDAASDHNAAIVQTLATVPQAPVAIFAADLPCLTPNETARFLTMTEPETVRIAPDRWTKGTNALLMSRPDLIAPGFGKNSFLRHIRSASLAGATVRPMFSAGTGSDIDTGDDLFALRSGCRGQSTSTLLLSSEFESVLTKWGRGAA